MKRATPDDSSSAIIAWTARWFTTREAVQLLICEHRQHLVDVIDPQRLQRDGHD